MLRKIINKPVAATVISILLVILGIIGLTKLPLEQFPDIALPSVQVKATYPGANAETILRSVAPPIEESINGVEGLSHISSTASNDGTLHVMVYFKLGVDPDKASINVQNRVAQASSQLPPEVLLAGVTTAKQQNNLIYHTDIYSESELYDESFLTNYAEINILPEIRRIKGIGSAAIIGNKKDYAMRIWLDPTKMANYKITPNEVKTIIQDNSLEVAPGKLGKGSEQAFEYTLKHNGKFNTAQEFENIIIKSNSHGSFLRIKDVARVELGTYTYDDVVRLNGKTSVSIMVNQLSGGESNANEIQIALNELMERASEDFPKDIKYVVTYTTKAFIDSSINQVKTTLIEAFILVFIVVFVFLQDIRATLIPAITVPVSIIGTFFFMYIFGFSINMLPLFALVLAIGIVVDDAIVVVEAVHAKMTNHRLSPKNATISAMSEITSVVISITLVMSAVFLPIGFMEGPAGVFYKQFAFTLAIAIVISAVNALTLSPALCAILLKENPHDQEGKRLTFKDKFFIGFEKGFSNLTERYIQTVNLLIKRKWLAITGMTLVIMASFLLIKKTQTGFIPSEDQGFIAISISLPSGSSLERTIAITEEVLNAVKDIESIHVTTLNAGIDDMTGTSNPSKGSVYIVLKPLQQRTDIQNIDKFVSLVNDKIEKIKGANFFVFTYPTVPGFGNVDALEVVIQDRSGRHWESFNEQSKAFISKLQERKEIAVAFTGFSMDYPQYEIEIDYEKVATFNVNTKEVFQTLQGYFGTVQANDFNRFGKYYRVFLQASPQNRVNTSSLNSIFVKNDLGDMVPLNSMVILRRVYGAETLSRFNLYNAIKINVIPTQGYSSGQAINAIQDVADLQLPSGYSYEFTGLAKEEIASGSQSVIIFAMCLMFVYLLLSAQYESYLLPIAVILSIPTGILGVFLAIGFAGIDNNIYVQVALVMLIGLLAKNAILIVEFANQLRDSGKSLFDSAVQASRMRLRPIMMTSLAFVVGIIPMTYATGTSAQGNHSISISAIGDMVTGVILGILIVPVLFVLFKSLHERIKISPKRKISSN